MDINVELTQWIRARDLLVGHQINEDNGDKLTINSVKKNYLIVYGTAHDLHQRSLNYYYPIDELIRISYFI